jgi:two-component sensor histidine kinase
LTFSDNGIGLPPGFDIHTTRTLGMNLIASLTQQLHGDIEISTNNGTRYVITIPAT